MSPDDESQEGPDTAGGDPLDDPAAELQLVEQRLAELRAEADQLRQETGDPAAEPGDQAARANLITSLELQEALIADLEARADSLRQHGTGTS
jgi:hypothetical protein